jgi:DNA-binding transcriptional LysR family regulator
VAIIQRLSRKHPRVVFHVVLGGALALREALRERHIELGVARLPAVAIEDDVEAEILFEEPLVVVAGMANPWIRRRKIELAELVNEPWTWSAPGTMFDTLVIDAFRTTGLEPPRATVYAEAINVRIRLAATGPFLAVIPAYMLKFHAQHASIKKLSVELPMTQRSIGVITLKNRTLSPLAQNFIECAVKPPSRCHEGSSSSADCRVTTFPLGHCGNMVSIAWRSDKGQCRRFGFERVTSAHPPKAAE